jgi:protein phosphatase
LLAADPAKPTETQLVEAHDAIVAAASANSDLAGMGSTAVVARIMGRTAEISWVGDSRAYLWRGGKLEQLTRDHSFIEVLRAQNILTEEQLRADPRGNLVTQTLGLGDPKPSVVTASLRYGDRILLCSDGLNDEVEDIQIAEILALKDDVTEAVEELVETALENGGRDNTSVIIVEFRGGKGIAFLWRILESQWLPLITGVILAVIFALVLWAKH